MYLVKELVKSVVRKAPKEVIKYANEKDKCYK